MISLNGILIDGFTQYCQWNEVVECDVESLEVFKRVHELLISYFL